MDPNGSRDRLSTLPPEIQLNICSLFCQCCRDDICKYDLNPQGNFGPDWYLLPGKKSDARALSNLCLISPSLLYAAQEVLHHAPYVEGTSSIVKLCRTVVKRPDLGLAIRVLPVWDFGGLEAEAAKCWVLPVGDLLGNNGLPFTPELRARHQSRLARRESKPFMAAPERQRWIATHVKPLMSFLPAYAMDMIVRMAKRARCFYGVQFIRRFTELRSPMLKPLSNLRECYLFLGEADRKSHEGLHVSHNYTHMAYDHILPALFQACPQLSVLGLQVDLDTLGGVFASARFTAAEGQPKNDIPIQRLELRFQQSRRWDYKLLDGRVSPRLRFLPAYFEKAPKLAEMYFVFLATQSRKPMLPADDRFAALLPIMNDLTENMTTAAKDRIRRLAFLNPGLEYRPWSTRQGDPRMLSEVCATEESLSFCRHFPNLEVLEVSAHFAYKANALATVPDGLKELRIHDSVPDVATSVLNDDILKLIARRQKRQRDDFTAPDMVVFASPSFVDGVRSYHEEREREHRVHHETMGQECQEGTCDFFRQHWRIQDVLPDTWPIPRSNEQLERDLHRLL